MDVKNCRDCGRLFNYIGGVRLCADCKAKLEEKFTEVKRYIEEHKNATVPEVSEQPLFLCHQLYRIPGLYKLSS